MGGVCAGATYDVIFSTRASLRRVRACLLAFHVTEEYHHDDVIDGEFDQHLQTAGFPGSVSYDVMNAGRKDVPAHLLSIILPIIITKMKFIIMSLIVITCWVWMTKISKTSLKTMSTIWRRSSQGQRSTTKKPNRPFKSTSRQCLHFRGLGLNRIYCSTTTTIFYSQMCTIENNNKNL